jgi:hypothetical protein
VPEGTQSALTKISRAIDRGTLTRVSVQTGGSIIAVIDDEPPRSGSRNSRRRRQPSHPLTVAWFERNFPGGYHRVARRGGYPITRANKDPGLDRWEYLAEADGRAFGLIVRYSRPHTHHEVRTVVFLEDEPVPVAWCCASCTTVLTAAQAKELALPTRRVTQQ